MIQFLRAGSQGLHVQISRHGLMHTQRSVCYGSVHASHRLSFKYLHSLINIGKIMARAVAIERSLDHPAQLMCAEQVHWKLQGHCTSAICIAPNALHHLLWMNGMMRCNIQDHDRVDRACAAYSQFLNLLPTAPQNFEKLHARSAPSAFWKRLLIYSKSYHD